VFAQVGELILGQLREIGAQLGGDLRACLGDRMAENDPDEVPASCQGAGAQTQDPTIGAYVVKQVHAGFQDTTIRTMGVAVLLLLFVLGLSFLLPREVRPDAEAVH